MNKYVITSDKSVGEVTFIYNDQQLLVHFDYQMDAPDDKPLRWTLASLIYQNESDFLNAVKRHKLRCTRVIKEVNFDEFWEKYDHKSMSSKHKSLVRWQNLSKTDQIRAFEFIPKYNARRSSMVPSPAKKLAETYLNSMMWNNSL